MPTFDKSHVPMAFEKILTDNYITPKLYAAEELNLISTGSGEVDYESAKKILLHSSDKNYPYYVFTIIKHMVSLDSIPPVLNALFQTIDFNKLAGPALNAQPNLKAKLNVFLIIMGLFYDQDLLQSDQADTVIKRASESLNESLLDILANEIAGDTASERNDLVGLMTIFPEAITCYYEDIIRSKDNCCVQADRMNHFVEQLKGTLLYEAMLVSLQQADYYTLYRTRNPETLFIKTRDFKQPKELKALMMGHDYKKALLTVADLPACKQYFNDKLIKYGCKPTLLEYLEHAIFKDNVTELYDFLEKVIPESYFDELHEDNPLVKIQTSAMLARQTALDAAEQDKKMQALMEKAVKKVLSPAMDRFEAMLGIIANSLGTMERRLANLEKQTGAQIGSPKARGFFPPVDTPSSSSVAPTPAASGHKGDDASSKRDDSLDNTP
jgi:hypothetical protein